jgi:hypothetical protein
MRSLPAFLLTVTVLGCGGGASDAARTQSDERLPAADSTHQRLDNTIVFELPDTGGFLANGQPVRQEDIPGHLARDFAPREPGQRAVMVRDNPKRREDAHWIARAARAAGGAAFDAELSGWPPREGPP